MEKLEGCCVPQACCQLPPSVVHVHHVPFSLFFFSIPKDKQPFFSWHGGFKERDHLSMFSFYLSVFIYIYDTHIYIYLFYFSSVAWSFIQTTCVTVLSLITSVLLTPVLLSCRIVALSFQSSDFYSKVQASIPKFRLCRVVIILHTWVYYTLNLLSQQHSKFLIEI